MQEQLDELTRERDAYIAYEKGILRNRERLRSRQHDAVSGDEGEVLGEDNLEGTKDDWEALVRRKNELAVEEERLRKVLEEKEKDLEQVRIQEERIKLEEEEVDREETECVPLLQPLTIAHVQIPAVTRETTHIVISPPSVPPHSTNPSSSQSIPSRSSGIDECIQRCIPNWPCPVGPKRQRILDSRDDQRLKTGRPTDSRLGRNKRCMGVGGTVHRSSRGQSWMHVRKVGHPPFQHP